MPPKLIAMTLAFKGQVEEEIWREVLQIMGTRSSYLDILAPHERNIVHGKFTQNYEVDDVIINLLEADQGIVNNTVNPYPTAIDGEYGLMLITNVSLGNPSDYLWGHIHLLHLMQDPSQFFKILKNPGMNSFCAIYLHKNELFVWDGLGSISAMQTDQAIYFTNSQKIEDLFNNTYELPKKTLLKVGANNEISVFEI